MSDKRDDVPKTRGRPSPRKRRRAELAHDIRALYQKYSEGDVPQHLRDLAEKIGQAYEAAHPAAATAVQAEAEKSAAKPQKKRRRVTASGGR